LLRGWDGVATRCNRAAAMGPAVPNTCSKLTPCGLSGCYLAIKVVKLQVHTPMRARKIYWKLGAHLMSCKIISKFVYRNRTQLYGAYTSKNGNNAQQSCAYKRVRHNSVHEIASSNS